MGKEIDINNMEVNKKKNYVVVSLDPVMYPLDVIYSAAYVMMDRAWIIFDGHPDEEVLVELIPKKGENPKKLGLQFNEELLNYLFYNMRADKTRQIREIIMKKAFLTHMGPYDVSMEPKKKK